MSFANKTILITGASSGIGAHAAQHLAKKGGNIALVGRNQERMNAVCEQIKCDGSPTPLAIVADVTSDAERIVSETINHFGKLNVLINNAAILTCNSIENIDLGEYDRTMNTNVRAAIEITKLSVPYLTKTKGNILNVSSASGVGVKPNSLAYCISKGGINQFTKSAALDLAPKGIRVNAIVPAAIQTPIFEKGFGMSPDQVAAFLDAIKNLYPLGRAGEVSDTSSAIEFLIGDSASFLTGVLLPVDGGSLTAGKYWI